MNSKTSAAQKAEICARQGAAGVRNPAVPSDQAAFDGEPLAGYHRTQSAAGYDFFALTESSP